MSSPAIQLYVRDWIISTRHLSGDARAAHIDLLCYGWEQGGIPDDVSALAAMCALPVPKFRKAWGTIESKWPLAEDGRRRNPRQEAQRKELEDHRAKQAENGKKGAEARWGNRDE